MSAFARAREGGVQAVRAWRWVLPEEAARGALARELSGKGDALQLFDDVEAPALLAVAWATDPESASGQPLYPPSRPSPEWAADAVRIASWRAERNASAGCLVMVRQPLKAPDPTGQRDWVATVLRALQGDEAAPEGLLTANFFASRDGAVVLNFAEWTSAEAHREALRRGSYGRHGSIGSSELWRAAREHPAITAEHEVRRYALHAALAPG